MAKKKVDLGRLMTASNHAKQVVTTNKKGKKKVGVSVRTVQYWMSKGKVPTEFVDG